LEKRKENRRRRLNLGRRERKGSVSNLKIQRTVGVVIRVKLQVLK